MMQIVAVVGAEAESVIVWHVDLSPTKPGAKSDVRRVGDERRTRQSGAAHS